MITRLILSCVLAALPALYSFGQGQDTLWRKLLPYFTPPAIYTNDSASYRSPLRFDDGRLVLNKKEWIERRQEILQRWHSLMGKWPPPVQHPSYVITDSVTRENVLQYTIQFTWRTHETTKAYLLVPRGAVKRPAVISVFYEPETGIGLKKPLIDYAWQLARQGFVTLSVGTAPVATQAPFAQYYPNHSNAQVQPLSMLAYLAGNCLNLLADRPEVDSSKIGIIGFSYGSKWAMFASCLDERFACAVWIDGGVVFDDQRPNVNYWDPWYLGYYPPPWTTKKAGLYPQLRKMNIDLTDLHALMAPRPFFVSGGAEDPPERWRALMSAVRVNELLGYHHRVGMSNRKDHMPDSESNEIIINFFRWYLMKE